MLHRNAFCALALLCISGSAAALELGFESLISATASDNISADNAGEEVEGQTGTIEFGVFGEQKGTKVRGAFEGRINAQRQIDDPDDDFNSVTQFFGAAEWSITPRTLSWYVGDVMGGVRSDNGIQSIDDFDESRRNVFVTGPEFNFDIDSFSRVNARLLYINQSEDDVDLDTLYNASASWEIDSERGNTWGINVGDIYTDSPESDLEGDFNRLTVAGFWRRLRGRNSYEAQLGGTRYDTEENSLNGANARLTFGRQLGPQTAISASFSRDLQDQTLSTIETLIADGSGLAPNGDGFFDETRLDFAYDYTSALSAFDASIGFGQSDFRLLADNAGLTVAGDSEDRNNFYASTSFSRELTPRLGLFTGLSYEKQDFINRLDNAQSVLGTLRLVYQLTRSFELEVGYRGSVSDGERTLVSDTTGNTVDDIDITENRATIGLRWAPPSRASTDLTIELKSLLQ